MTHTRNTFKPVTINLLYYFFLLNVVIKRKDNSLLAFYSKHWLLIFLSPLNFYSVDFNATILNTEKNTKQIQKTPTHNEMFLVLKHSAIA